VVIKSNVCLAIQGLYKLWQSELCSCNRLKLGLKPCLWECSVVTRCTICFFTQ